MLILNETERLFIFLKQRFIAIASFRIKMTEKLNLRFQLTQPESIDCSFPYFNILKHIHTCLTSQGCLKRGRTKIHIKMSLAKVCVHLI